MVHQMELVPDSNGKDSGSINGNRQRTSLDDIGEHIRRSESGERESENLEWSREPLQRPHHESSRGYRSSEGTIAKIGIQRTPEGIGSASRKSERERGGNNDVMTQTR